jgi:hypothetical protein
MYWRPPAPLLWAMNNPEEETMEPRGQLGVAVEDGRALPRVSNRLIASAMPHRGLFFVRVARVGFPTPHISR